jgi:ubiquinone/menaquinone biosynthesis C-methylase UbiE
MVHILGKFGPSIMKIYGVDVSEKALGLARTRLGVHSFIPSKWELQRVSDDSPRLDFPDEFFDFVNCQGVLHHTSHPQELLKEFYRMLRPGGHACIMVYNRESIFYHLEVAYKRAILDHQPGTPADDVDELFQKSTDGEACPISIAYRPEVFSEMCRRAGFDCEYRGGYFALSEYLWVFTLLVQALKDNRLAREHREFLDGVRMHRGYPTVAGKACGIGGVYTLRKVDNVDSID